MTSPQVATRITQRLVAWRWLLLALATVPVILAGVSDLERRFNRPIEHRYFADSPYRDDFRRVMRVFGGHLRFDRSIENMFSPHHPLLVPYRRLKRTFGGNEVVVAAYVDPELMTPGGLERLRQLSLRLEQVPGVRSALSLERLIGDDILQPGGRAERLRNLFEGYTHGADGETAAVVCILIPEGETAVSRDVTVGEMRRAVAELPHGTIAGEPVMVVDGFQYIEQDGRRLGWISTVLLTLTIALCFRSLRWVVVPLVVVYVTLLVTRAILVALGFRLSFVSSMLAALVTVVGVATVMHVIVRYRDARRTGATAEDALVLAGTVLAVPIFWACATDAVGFASLLTAGIGPIRDFGVMMATGSLLVIVSVALVVPGLALAGRFDRDPKWTWGEDRLDGGLRRTLGWVEHRPRLVAVTALALAAGAIVGSTRLEVETDFTKNFRRDSPIVQSYEFVESRLGGAGVWDVIVPAPARLDWDYLSQVRGFEQRLEQEVPELTKVISLASAVQAGAPVDPAQLPSGFLRDRMVRMGLTMIQTGIPVFAEALYGEDPQQPGKHCLRIMLRAKERQPAEQKHAVIARVEQISREEFARIRALFPRHFDDGDQAEVTGFFVLLANLIDSMTGDQWRTFRVAMAGIGLMMLIAFRSLPLALVALVPNAVPVLMVMGLMGWLGLKINMGAAMIAAVSLGLSIDASIHYISGFRRARRSGQTTLEALDSVQQTVGRALVFATLALIVGFSALCLSEFVPIIYFGALVSLSMLGGLAGNLVVLPLLLKWVSRE